MEKRAGSIVNDYDTFTTVAGETVMSPPNRFNIYVNNLIAYVLSRTPLKHSNKFINSIGRG